MTPDDTRALKSAGASDTIMLSSDPFWLLKVRVPSAGDPVPFQYHMLYRWQFGAPTVGVEEVVMSDQADGTP